VVLAEIFGVGRRGIPGFAGQQNPLGYLTSQYWSRSARWVIEAVVVLTGLGFVVASLNVSIRVLFAMGRERALPPALARLSGRHTPAVAIECVTLLALALGLPLTYLNGGTRTFGYLAGAGGLSVVLIYLALNIATIRAFRTEFRGEFKVGRHLLAPAAAAVLFMFPLWGLLHPRTHYLADLLPFIALSWLALGVIAAGILRARRPASFEAIGRVFAPARK
jgi:amino acid transporter